MFIQNRISNNIASEVSEDAGTGGGIALFIRTDSPHIYPLMSLIGNDIVSNTAVLSPTSSTGVGGVGGGVAIGGKSTVSYIQQEIYNEGFDIQMERPKKHHGCHNPSSS